MCPAPDLVYLLQADEMLPFCASLCLIQALIVRISLRVHCALQIIRPLYSTSPLGMACNSAVVIMPCF